MKLIIRIFSLLSCYFLASCISVSIPSSKLVKASDVTYQQPSEPFITSEHDSLDSLWSNPRNGNSISYLSDCQSKNDPPLKTITMGIIRDLGRREMIESKLIPYNQREGLHSKYSGSVDGVPTIVELIVLKKNSCIYVLTYVALKEAYTTNIGDFEKFYQGFKAP